MSFADLISDNATQEVRLQRLITSDSYEGNTYDPPDIEDAETIMAVYEPASGLTRTLGGDEVAVESRVLTQTSVGLGDKIEGSAVRRVAPVPDFDGTTIGYEVFL